MADLIAWLDAQERKPFSRVAPIDETVEAFDPLHRGFVAEDFAIPVRILEIYDRGEQGMEGRGGGIRRTRKWRFAQDLAKPLVPQMMNKIKQAVQTRHKINYRNAFAGVAKHRNRRAYGLLYKHQQPMVSNIIKNERMANKTGRVSPSRRKNRQTQHEMGF